MGGRTVEYKKVNQSSFLLPFVTYRILDCKGCFTAGQLISQGDLKRHCEGKISYSLENSFKNTAIKIPENHWLE